MLSSCWFSEVEFSEIKDEQVKIRFKKKTIYFYESSSKIKAESQPEGFRKGCSNFFQFERKSSWKKVPSFFAHISKNFVDELHFDGPVVEDVSACLSDEIENEIEIVIVKRMRLFDSNNFFWFDFVLSFSNF